jgi:hypothetical protein
MKSLTWLLWKWLEEAIKRINKEKISHLSFFRSASYISGNQYLPAGGAEVKRMK